MRHVPMASNLALSKIKLYLESSLASVPYDRTDIKDKLTAVITKLLTAYDFVVARWEGFVVLVEDLPSSGPVVEWYKELPHLSVRHYGNPNLMNKIEKSSSSSSSSSSSTSSNPSDATNASANPSQSSNGYDLLVNHLVSLTDSSPQNKQYGGITRASTLTTRL